VSAPKRAEPFAADTLSDPESFARELAGALERLAASARGVVLHDVVLERFLQRVGAGRASLLVLNPASGHLRFAAVRGMPGELVGQDTLMRDRSISDWVYRNRCGVILNGEVDDSRFEGSAPHSGIGGAICVPITSERGVFGVLNLARLGPTATFKDAELDAVELALRHAARWIEQAWDLERIERHGARLDEFVAAPPVSRIPRGASEIRGAHVAFAHLPGLRVGGDVCDRASHPEGGYTIMLADVTGEGQMVVATAALVRGLFVGLASTDRSPIEIASRLNAELIARGGDSVVAMWIAHLSPNGQVLFCNAGYPAPFWVPADGSETHRLDTGGPLLGAGIQAGYEQESLRLLPGDTLIAVSDGVLTARNHADRELGAMAVLDVAAEQRNASLDKLVDAICAAAASHAAHARPIDDLAALALRFTRED